MKNSAFEITLDPKTGYLTSLILAKDPHRMNWCSEEGAWGRLKTIEYPVAGESGGTAEGFRRLMEERETYSLFAFSQDETQATAIYKSGKLRVTVSYSFTAVGNLLASVTVENISPSVVCLSRDTFGVEMPLNDSYPDAETCMTMRCNAHIWCGGDVSWIYAPKMGPSSHNLGVFLTDGSLASYSQIHCADNKRGSFILEPTCRFLAVGESYTLSWEFFPCTGRADFWQHLRTYDRFVSLKAEHYTVFSGEDIRLHIAPANQKAPRLECDGEPLACTQEANGEYLLSYTPKRCGEHRIKVTCGEVSTFAEFMVKPPFAEFVQTRVRFITEKQQCLEKSLPLYGAYLIYDNKTGTQYHDFFCTDHNACRERMNMPLLLIRYAALRGDEALLASIDRYVDFLFREFYEESTGEVFNNIGKTKDALRLYNAPGVCLILAELYHLTGKERYLDNILRLLEKYYEIGGERCYSNAVAPRKVISAFEAAGEGRKKDKERLIALFSCHAENIIKNGLSYPKHEVNYEQTIVTPAVTILSEVGLYSEDRERYIREARQHIECLDRLTGEAPSFHLNEIALRYWDGFWFGKAKRRGDTLPHHLSCLNARAFAAFARLSGEKEYAARAEECLRNCLCLIGDAGDGHAACIYPHTVNGFEGEFYDEWANDQDLPLYDALNAMDLLPVFSL